MKTALKIIFYYFLTGLFASINIKNSFGCVEDYVQTNSVPKQNVHEENGQLINEIILTENKIKELKKMSLFERRDFLCKGEISQPLEIQKQLKCRYVNRGVPFLKIAPFKEEEIFLEPRILMFHDVIYDKEIDIIMNLAKPKLSISEFINTTSGMHEANTALRDSQNGWLEDFEHEYVETLSYRIEDMTYLNIDTSEALQVAYYKIGGHYRPHVDFLLDEDMNMCNYDGIGNRIATVLLYLNDVEQGGHTVFTELNISLKPRKGAAAFWYNLKPNGERDYSTIHSACPVISGVKWAANKWLHDVGQEFHRPCPRNNETVILN